MPLDPYFTSKMRNYIPALHERPEAEQREVEDMLSMSRPEQQKLNLEIWKRLRLHQPTTGAEKTFTRLFKKRYHDLNDGRWQNLNQKYNGGKKVIGGMQNV